MTGGFRDLRRTRAPAHGRLPARFNTPLLAIGALAVVAVVALVVVLVVHARSGSPDTSGETTAPVVTALDVPVGGCIDSGGLSDPNLVIVVSCAQPHEAAVFARLLLPAADVVTDDAIRAAADRACQAAVPQSAGTDVQVSFFYPTAEDAADNQDHRLTCVFDTSGDPSPSS